MAVEIYSGFLNPYAERDLITTFLIGFRGCAPDADTRARLAERSETFRQRQGKAEECESDVTNGSADRDSPARLSLYGRSPCDALTPRREEVAMLLSTTSKG
ncbi:hypothetical protein ACFQH2_12480 [Natronoarchaeum sp. GCM10025703]|uniref:hypothetical protein n=1 Tax=unclassified Natronoarchaeum TaxID=2620183 RepID=UPI00360A6AAA